MTLPSVTSGRLPDTFADLGGHAVVAVDVATHTSAGQDGRVGAEGALGQADWGGRLAQQGGESLRNL